MARQPRTYVATLVAILTVMGLLGQGFVAPGTVAAADPVTGLYADGPGNSGVPANLGPSAAWSASWPKGTTFTRPPKISAQAGSSDRMG